MAWEWVAPTATAVVALGGIAATWLTARGGRQTQLSLQLAQHIETRRLVEQDARRTAYARFAGEARALHQMVVTQHVLNDLADEKDAEIKDHVYGSLGVNEADIALQRLLRENPELEAEMSHVRENAVAFQQLLPLDQVLARVMVLERLAAEMMLFASSDVRQALLTLEKACFGPAFLLLAHTAAEPDDMRKFTTALASLELRMSEELGLVSAGALTEPFSRANGPVLRPQTASEQAKH